VTHPASPATLGRVRLQSITAQKILDELPPILDVDQWLALTEAEHAERRARTIDVLKRCIAELEARRG
jgi:hypothetical protein